MAHALDTDQNVFSTLQYFLLGLDSSKFQVKARFYLNVPKIYYRACLSKNSIAKAVAFLVIKKADGLCLPVHESHCI